jgi:hypothetical protein
VRNLIVSILAIPCLALTACYADGGGGVVVPGDDPSDPFDMTGAWVLTRSSVDPPFAFDCTEDLAGREFSFCESFEVSVAQDDVYFFPGPGNGEGEPFCDSRFAMSGSATIAEIYGEIERAPAVGTAPPVPEIQYLEFNAGVIGDSATFALARLTLEGVNGECTMGGSYLGLRTDSR